MAVTSNSDESFQQLQGAICFNLRLVDCARGEGGLHLGIELALILEDGDIS